MSILKDKDIQTTLAQFRLNLDDYEILKELCKTMGWTLSQGLRMIVSTYLNNCMPKEIKPIDHKNYGRLLNINTKGENIIPDTGECAIGESVI
jgi:hypothetical protein